MRPGVRCFDPIVFLFPMIGFTGGGATAAVQIGYTVADIVAKAMGGLQQQRGRGGYPPAARPAGARTGERGSGSMRFDADLAILGGGCAGLSLGVRLDARRGRAAPDSDRRASQSL
ncbi:MAG: hypothetical protein U5K74_05250 [Gemmatimonadaceae bacterium]|nr:hypothetical protein [Gemmatimonadaceae bacterium]